jgi:hypothetical protein
MDFRRIKEQWWGWYGKAPPVAHVMREVYEDRWLRIHSLPRSRRYPDSASDWEELLARHNAVATELLGDGEPCILFTTCFDWGDSPLPARLSDVPVAPAPTRLEPLDETWPGEEPLRQLRDDGTLWLYATELRWSAGAYDPLLRAVADDKTGRVLLVSSGTGRVYAPYDGGADLFFLDPEERRAARERHRAWLSSHPEGL